MSEEKRLVKFIKMQGQVFQFEPPLSEVSLLECVGQSNLRLQNLPKKKYFFFTVTELILFFIKK